MATYAEIDLAGTLVRYQVKSVARSRTIRIRITARGEVVVTKPKRLHRLFAHRFVARNAQWVGDNLVRHRERAARDPAASLRYGPRTKAAALALVRNRIEHFNADYGFAVGRISIRNQSTRWGSCSGKGNLSFNYRIIALSPEHADYLVVHELCHIREHNHSSRFWALVAKAIPDYRRLRDELRALPLA